MDKAADRQPGWQRFRCGLGSGKKTRFWSRRAWPPGISPHDLRHSCAGLLLAAGVPAPNVAAILRHADPRITLMVYAGLVESQRAELKDDLELALGGAG